MFCLPLGVSPLPLAATPLRAPEYSSSQLASRRERSLLMRAESSGNGSSPISAAKDGSAYIRPHLRKLAPYTPIEPFEILSKRYLISHQWALISASFPRDLISPTKTASTALSAAKDLNMKRACDFVSRKSKPQTAIAKKT